MAIRFKHQVGAGIIGAFATGHANAQNRRRKYALDMMQQEREHQMRMQERIAPYKYRAALGGGRGGGRGGVEPAGMWIDPAADTTLTEDEKIKLRVKQNAQRRAAARAMRMGRAPTATDALPWFKSQAAIDAEKQADAAFIKREQEIEDERRAQAGREKLATMGQEADAAAERLAGQQALAKERMKAIEADIGNGRYSPDDAKLLRAKQRDIQQTLLSGRFTDEDQRQEELDRLRAERDEIIDRKLPEETVGDKYGKGVHWARDPNTGKLMPIVEGPNGPEIMNRYKPSDPGAAEAEKAAKRRAAIKADADKLYAGGDGQFGNDYQAAVNEAIRQQGILDKTLNPAGPLQQPGASGDSLDRSLRAAGGLAALPKTLDPLPAGQRSPQPLDTTLDPIDAAGGAFGMATRLDETPPQPVGGGEAMMSGAAQQADSLDRSLAAAGGLQAVRREQAKRALRNVETVAQQIQAGKVREAQARQKVQSQIPPEFRAANPDAAAMLQALGGIPANQLTPVQREEARKALAALREFRYQQQLKARQRPPENVGDRAYFM